MKIRHIILPLLLTAAPLAASGAEEVVLDLTTSTALSQCSHQSLRYDRDSNPWTINYSGAIQLYSYNITDGYYDDYLLTPDLDLLAGNEYAVTFKPSVYSSLKENVGNISVLIGQGDDLEAYTLLGEFKELPYGFNVPGREASFVPEADGKYRFAFRAWPCAVKLTDTKVVNRGQSPVPKGVDDLTAAPDPDGALNVTVSFTIPSTTLTGQPLADVKYNFFRGVQKIRSEVSARPGEKVTVPETRGESGMVVYAVEILAGDQTSGKVSVETYVGPETPGAPADVALTMTDGQFVVSWSAPAKGTHGVTLDPSRLSYTVTRVLDGERIVVAQKTTATSFSEQLTPDGLQNLSYSVTASYGTAAKVSDPAECAPMRIGSLELPFADSFAGAVLSPLWTNEIVSGSDYPNYYWQTVAEATTSKVKTQPFDADSGLLIYKSYNCQNGSVARLSTPPLAFASGMKPVLNFAMYHIDSNRRNDITKVQISCDYGEWTDVPGAEFGPVDPDGTLGWKNHSVNLEEAIPAGTKTFRVALLAVSDYGEDMALDNVRLFNLVEKDLEIAVMSAPESVKAGNEIEITLKVSNNGSADIAADGYSVEITSDFPDAVTFPVLKPIGSLGYETYTLTIPVTSLHAFDTDSYSFAFDGTLAGDEVPGNNSAVANVAVGFSVGDPAANLAFEKTADAVTLGWNAAKDLEYVPVNIIESFEDESFADGSTGPFNGWTIVDLDGAAGDRWYTAGGSAFNLCQNAGTPSGVDGRNCLGVTVKSNTQQNDWVISPLINCKEGRTMNLSMLVGLRNISSYGNTYSITLLYSTSEDFDILNPQTSFTNQVGVEIKSTSYSDRVLPQDNKMHEITFEGIPAEARRVALHFAAKGSYSPAMWLDNIRLTEVDENPLLGYHVYDLASHSRVNAEMIGAGETTFVIPSAEAATYAAAPGRELFVSAVYPDGEARPTNTVKPDETVSGVENVASGDASAVPEYFDLQGRRVLRPASGVYIERRGSSVRKVVIR